MTFSTWLLFLSVSLVAAFSPGPGVLMAISTATTMGPKRALYSSSGNALGIFMVATLAVTGLGLLLKTSALAFGALKIAGAAYLVYLGVKAWRSAGQLTEGTQNTGPAAAAPAGRGTPLHSFRSGLLVAISNPKSILFFTAVFPQFMPADHIDPAGFLLLTATFTGCSLLSHLVYVLCAAWFKSSVKHSLARSRLAKRGTGAIYVGMGGALLSLSNSR